jgi:putative flavoprotein involved in K+ transport
MCQSDAELDAVVIGAGWAGIAASSALHDAGIRHRVFEKKRVCETWRTQRWNSFHMNTPNVLTVMPGDKYVGADPEGYMTRDAFVSMVEAYAVRRKLPVETGTPVASVRADGSAFEIVTPTRTYRTRNVIVATGNLNVPKRPASASKIPATVRQIDTSDYRDASQLAPGAVLVIGCGNSGGQIAEDLAHGGRTVYLATGRNGRIPRRYRHRDIVLWLVDNGRFGKPRTSDTGRPLLGATHTISLQALSAQGIFVLGRFAGVAEHGELIFADDLRENAQFGDQVSSNIKAEIDAYIEENGLSAAAVEVDEAETVAARFPEPPILKLDPIGRGISTVIWCIGFKGDFSWLNVPGALDSNGEPAQERCISVPGVYFVGLDSTETLKAGTILAAEDESRRVADHILARQAERIGTDQL